MVDRDSALAKTGQIYGLFERLARDEGGLPTVFLEKGDDIIDALRPAISVGRRDSNMRRPGRGASPNGRSVPAAWRRVVASRHPR